MICQLYVSLPDLVDTIPKQEYVGITKLSADTWVFDCLTSLNLFLNILYTRTTDAFPDVHKLESY